MSLGPASTSQAPTENLAGLVERVTFHNEENGFRVLRVKARGQRDLITVIGHAAMISAGEWIRTAGTWTNDRTHGLQFRAAFLKATPPTTIEGIERYLGSGMIRGIGPAYAERLVKTFGESVFDVIEAEPARLREVGGIGPKRAERIAAGWAEQKVVREIMLFLHADGVGTSRAVRIGKTYGAEAVAVISENPYRLARDIRGIGFKTADQIAAKLGIAKDSMVRVRAGVSYALAEAMDEGHCGLPEDDLLRTGAELIEVTADRLTDALALELQEGAVVADTVGERRCIFLAGLYRAERDIAERLQSLAGGEPPWPAVDIDGAIPWLESRGGLTLAPSQREALRLAVARKALVITGGPGVGKTTLVNSILKVLVAKSVNVALCAPTGRAAKRLTETTGVEAKSIHRLLETDPKNGGFKRDEANPLGCVGTLAGSRLGRAGRRCRQLVSRPITAKGVCTVSGGSVALSRRDATARSNRSPTAIPIPVASTDTVVRRGWQDRDSSKSPKPAIARRPGTAQPRLWHSARAPKADRSDTHSTASTPGYRPSRSTTASLPWSMAIGGAPQAIVSPAGSPSSRMARS